MTDFVKLLSRLVESDVDFVLVDGMAAAAYGSTMLTQDIDVCCDFSIENLLRLQKAVSGLNPVHRLSPEKKSFNEDTETLSTYKNIYLDTDCGQLDCLGNIDGIGNYSDVKKLSHYISLAGKSFPILTLPALIRSKEAMGRPRDKENTLLLKAIQEKLNLDKPEI